MKGFIEKECEDCKQVYLVVLSLSERFLLKCPYCGETRGYTLNTNIGGLIAANSIQSGSDYWISERSE